MSHTKKIQQKRLLNSTYSTGENSEEHFNTDKTPPSDDQYSPSQKQRKRIVESNFDPEVSNCPYPAQCGQKKEKKNGNGGEGKKEWTFEMDKEILQKVSSGWKWREIANLQMFIQQKIDRNSIKRRFESDMRRKFRILFKRVFTCRLAKEKHITDRTYRMILSEAGIEILAQRGKISSSEADLIINSIPYFISPSWSHGRRETRSQQSQYELLSKLQFGTCITKLVQAIISVQDAIPQSRGFKLDDNCRRKQNMKTRSQRDSRCQQSATQISRCERPECEHNMRRMEQGEGLFGGDELVLGEYEEMESNGMRLDIFEEWSRD